MIVIFNIIRQNAEKCKRCAGMFTILCKILMLCGIVRVSARSELFVLIL